MEVMVFGAGYVGLIQAAGLASTGNKVYLVDISKERIDMLRRGETPIYEPGLEKLLQAGSSKSYLEFIHHEDENFEALKKRSEIYFLGVQTPEDEDGMPKLDYLFSAADMVIDTPGDLHEKLVVVKSTVPVGTGDLLEERFAAKGKKPIIASNPEFLKQGSSVSDFLHPERVIVGAENPIAFEVLGFLYKPFMLKRDRSVFMKRRSAELVKYACNSFLATKISFINEIARLSEKVGADIQEVREGMITDSRIGDQFLYPGIGYGGSCLPKDTHALIAQGKKAEIDLPIVRAVDTINKAQRMWPLEKVKDAFDGNLKGKVIALWGLSFKPNTDDLREAPSVPLVEKLLESGALIQAYDPAAMPRFKSHFPSAIQENKIKLLDNPYEASQKADVLIILTEWQEFRTPNFKILKENLNQAILIDGRGIIDPKILAKEGFKSYSVGIAREL